MSRFDVDVAVIGGGPGGLVAATLTAALGRKTLLFERGRLGGDCSWTGCVPSKTLIKSAQVAHQTRHLEAYGLRTARPQLDTTAVMDHVRDTVAAIGQEHTPDALASLGIDVCPQAARFLDAHRLQAGTRQVTARRIVLATGSRPHRPAIEGLDTVPVLTNETVFGLTELPRRLLVLGAGPIGVELGAALNRLGVAVTVVQRSDRFLKKEEPELADRLLALLRAEGLVVRQRTQVRRVASTPDGIRCDLETAEGPLVLTVDAILAATGRVPDLADLDLDRAGVTFDEHGVRVDRFMRTTARHIYACGDMVPPHQFTHVAEAEAVVAGTNAAFGLPLRRMDHRHVVWATYTDPELAHAGLTEAQARRRGHRVRIVRWDFGRVDRARTDQCAEGQVKVILDRRGRLLGAHILGPHATDLMHELQLAKTLGLPFHRLATVMHAYPSYADAIRQPAKRRLIEHLQQHPILRLGRGLRSGKVLTVLVVLLTVLALRRSPLADQLTLPAIQARADHWVALAEHHLGPTLAAYLGLYVVVTAFSLPGATVLTLTGGFLFGPWRAGLVVNLGATAGATLAFLFARIVAGRSLQARYSDKLATFNREILRNGAGYLLTLRLIPVFPFFLINLLAGLTAVRLWTFIWTTSVGILPGSLIYAYAGRQLREIQNPADILSAPVLAAFVLLAALACLPILVRHLQGHRRATLPPGQAER